MLLAFLAPWAAMAQVTLTVNDGTDNNSYVPFYGLYADTQGAASECVIPAEALAEMTGGTINSMTFYLTTPATVAWTGTHQVYLGEIAETILEGITGPSAFTVVAEGQYDATGSELTVTLATPYTYSGGNLLIGTYVSVAGNYKSAYFTGVNQETNTGWYRNNGTATGGSVKFLPKTTFTYEPATTGCDMPTSIAVSDVVFNGATVTWAGDGSTWNLRYKASTDADFTLVEGLTAQTYAFEGTLTENTTYSVGVQTDCGGGLTSPFRSATFTTPIACPAPTDFAATLTPGNGSVATLSWTSGASEWIVAYKTADDTDFTEETVTENPYTLNGLTPETTYTAKVKSVCGGEAGESAWSSEISFTPTDAYNLTVNDGTTTNSYVPIYGWYVDNITKSQFIIPAADLAAMQWGTINQLTFYASTSSTAWGAATFEVYMTETSETTLSELADYSTMEKVMNAGSLNISGNQMVVTLDAPYEYLGGNLLIGFLQTNSGSYQTSSWLGVSATGASMGGYGTSVSQQNFLPKVTFAYTPGVAPAYPKPTGLTVNYTGGTTAEVSWNSEATAWNIDVNGTVTEGITENPYTITGLELATTYSVMVQAVFGSNTSDWTNPVSFTTDLCMPENMCVINITLNDSYGDGWNGNKMEVVDVLTNEVLGTFTLTSGETGTFTPEYCIGRDINFVYVVGGSYTYPYENGWTITDINGDVISEHEGGDSSNPPTAGIVATHTVACPSCVKPNITLGEVTHTTANLTWNDKGVSYVLRYRTAESVVPAAGAFFDDFENGIDNWTIYQEGEAGGNWATFDPSSWDPMYSAHSGSKVAMARSYNGSGFDADNWLVSPELTIPAVMSFWVMGDPSYPETYSICVSTTDNAVDSFTAIATYTENPNEWTLMTIDLSAYEGETGYIAFHQYDNDKDFLWIDDVTIGRTETIPAGTWTEIPTTELSYEITGLTAGTKYDYQIKTICSDTDESDYTTVASFTTLSDRIKLFVTEGNWNEAANWVPEGEPTAEQDAVIKANVVIPSGCKAEANNITFEGSPTPTLTIEDGGELIHNNDVDAIVKKVVTGYEGNDNYVLLSSPISDVVPTTVDNMTDGDYDLYSFDATLVDEEWRNFKASAFNMMPGMGYLYANNATVTLTFEGTLPHPAFYYAGGSSTSYLYYDETTDLGKFNLVGNMFMTEGYISLFDGSNATTVTDFYVITNNGDGFMLNRKATLSPMQGAFIEATEADQTALISVKEWGRGNNSVLNMNVTSGNEEVDYARIRFGEGNGLSKMQLNANSSKLYMPVDNKEYAVVYSETEGEMPVNFKAEKNGTYTISFSTENVEFGYMHLIDNMTGADVDLLETPAYTFDAKTTDYASRFVLVFAAGSVNDNFAFYNGSEWVVNGEGTMQVVDVMGRVIVSQNINGNTNLNLNAAPGVYVIRLVNGDNVKVQKIVVR